MIAVKTMPKSHCKNRKNDLHEYRHSSVYILWNCKSKSIDDITWKTRSNSWTSCWYHHQNQSSEVHTNNELCETSCLPNRQNIYHKAATSTYDYLIRIIITLKVNKK